MYSLSSCWNSARHTCGREMLREIRELGFEYAELSHGIRLSLVPGVLDAVRAGEIKISTLHNFCPLPIGVNQAAPNLYKFSSSDKRERESALRHSRKTLEMAEMVDAKLVVLHSGRVDMRDYQDKLEAMVAEGKKETSKYQKLVEEMETKRGKRLDEAVELALDLIHELAEEASRRGVLLGIENREAVEEIPIDHEIEAFLDELPENVRYWHDCGHAQIKQNLGFIDHRMHFEGLAPRLAGLHVHDVVVGPEGQQDHVPPGMGTIDYAGLKPWVRPDHIKVIEMAPGVPADDIRKGYEHIRSIWGPE